MGGALMRFGGERDDPENAGLDKARQFLEPVKVKFPDISYADLWILAAYVGIEMTDGPKIEFVGGRVDAESEVKSVFGDGVTNTNGSRLPSADLGS
jgi:cytochrome c peroxidase